MYNEFSNMDSVELLGVVRNMRYKGHDIHYYTGLCIDEVFISLADILDIVSDSKRTPLMNVDTVVSNAKIIPNHVKNKRPYFIESYINNQCVTYQSVIKVCEYYGMKDLKVFLTNAVKMINDIGFYVEGLKFKYTGRTKNKEPNVSDLLRMEDLEKFYNNCGDLNYNYRIGDLYQEVVDRISYLVFNSSMSDLRWDLNLNSNDRVSSNISDEEYNELCIASKIFSYMLSCNYHLGLEYIEYLANEVLEMKCSNNRNNNVSMTTGEFEEEDESPNPYINVFKRLDSNRDDYYDNDNDDVDDFTRYM